tara:strand:- start:1759 stop:1986 length:228 start_codon:yes stop_codon:yes gene_type:complete
MVDLKLNNSEKAIKYELLKMEITGTLKAYNNLLKDYEANLKQYVINDAPQPLINVQQTLIIKLKAKIEMLNDLNN